MFWTYIKMKLISTFEPIKRIEKIDWVVILTLIYLIFYTNYPTPIKMIHLFIGTWGVLLFKFSKHYLYWAAISLIQIYYLYNNRFGADNHKYLFAYWVFALTFSFYYGRKNKKILNQLLEHNSKWLIGLTMAFAIFWKTYTPDYLNGQFMAFTLIDDNRFLFLVKLLTNLPPDYLELIDFQIFGIKHSFLGFSSPHLYNVYFLGQVKSLGLLFTWWVYLIELLIAVLFLLPEKFKLNKIRTYLLLGFILTTYVFLGVIGFGWLLIILGLAQVNNKNKHLINYFLVAFILIKIFTFLPFQNDSTLEAEGNPIKTNKVEQSRPQSQSPRNGESQLHRLVQKSR